MNTPQLLLTTVGSMLCRRDDLGILAKRGQMTGYRLQRYFSVGQNGLQPVPFELGPVRRSERETSRSVALTGKIAESCANSSDQRNA